MGHPLPDAPLMAYTAQDLAAIDAAIVALSTGERVTETRFADRLIKYQDISLADLRKLRSDVAQQLRPQRAPFSGRTWLCTQAGKSL